MPKQWKCLCGEWVDVKHPAHTHAALRREFDDKAMEWWTPLGYPPEIWAHERRPGDAVRESS